MTSVASLLDWMTLQRWCHHTVEEIIHNKTVRFSFTLTSRTMSRTAEAQGQNIMQPPLI